VGRNAALLEPTLAGGGNRPQRQYPRRSPLRDEAAAAERPRGMRSSSAIWRWPVIARSGEVVGGLILGHDQAGVFDEGNRGAGDRDLRHTPRSPVDNARLHQAAQVEIEHRRRAEETRALLLNEIKHRVKNTLAIIQAISAPDLSARLRARNARSFSARLRALAGAHDLLTDQNWDRAAMSDTVQSALCAVSGAQSGAHRSCRPRGLAQCRQGGAGRHGASRACDQCRQVRRLVEPNRGASASHGELVEGSRLRLRWCEAGGPPVIAPGRRGFGTRLIERSLSGEEGAAQFEFAPEGLNCTLELAL